MDRKITVKLTYFKKTGKYHSEGEFLTEYKSLHIIWEDIKIMFANFKRPGLIDGQQEFITLVEVPGHEHDHPILIFPERIG